MRIEIVIELDFSRDFLISGLELMTLVKLTSRKQSGQMMMMRDNVAHWGKPNIRIS